MKKILFAAVLVVSGCSKKTDTASGAQCAEAVSKAVAAMPGGSGGGEVKAKLQTVMTTRCTEDKWPNSAVSCYATATDMASMKKCREMLSQAQQTKLMAEIRAVMMSAAGAGGGPMHGGGAPAGGGEAPAGSAAPGSETPAPATGSAAVPATGSAAAPATGSAAAPATGTK